MIRYSAVVLSKGSQDEAVRIASKRLATGFLNQAGWEIIAHHCTLKLGPLDKSQKEFDNRTLPIIVNGIGISAKAVALRIKTGTLIFNLSHNKIPHITIGVNREADGKPVDSNYIENWEPLSKEYSLEGTIKEIK